MPVAPLAGFFAFATVNAFSQVDDQDLAALNHAMIDQRTKQSMGRMMLLRARSPGGCRSAFHVLSQAYGKALVHFWIALEKSEHDMMRHLGHPRATDGGHAHGAIIAQQVETASEIVSALSIGDDALVAALVARSGRPPARDFDEAFQQDVQRLSRWTALPTDFPEETFATLVMPHLRLLDKRSQVGIGDALEERHAFQNAADGSRIAQLLEDLPRLRDQFHIALHNLLWHLQDQRLCMCPHRDHRGLAGEHGMLAYVLPTTKHTNEQLFTAGLTGHDGKLAFKNKEKVAPILALTYQRCARLKRHEPRRKIEVQYITFRRSYQAAEDALFAQASDQLWRAPARRKDTRYALHVNLLLPGDADALLEREHQEVTVVIDGTNRHTGATHNAFLCEARDLIGNSFGNRGPVEIGDGNQR